MSADKWPRLSKTLPAFSSLGVCQRCGTPGVPGDSIARWQEHDDQDRPEPIIICLCTRCSDKIIEPHPRLYNRLQPCEPWPGAMQICRDCKLRQGTRCTSPEAKYNGGPGVMIQIERPTIAFLDGIRNGRRTGWRQSLWLSPATGCKQHVAVSEAGRS